ncbi:uncharacterized protein IWZ02DRAFT_479012 [Phyllosticta citriasiana]|uniref:uncharacterized protein n=1 Tax=Phyllosticta citriasiana TaxID=595635 RepID=UPI0030FDEADB
MRYFSIILLNMLATMLTASPNPLTPGPENPFFFGAYACSDPHWGGECIKIERLKGYCVNNGKKGTGISSFGPDQGFKCDLFRTIDCSGKSLHLEWPGTDDLGGWAKKVGSFRCE